MTATALDPSGARTRMAQRYGPAPHLVLYALIVLGVLLAAPLTSAFSSDDGAYGVQVRVLSEADSWVLPRPVAVVPVENEGMVNGLRTVAGPVPYSGHPLYVKLLQTSRSMFGQSFGMHLPAIAGTILTPLFAWLAAGLVDRRLRVGAFWTAAVSPVLVHGLGLWAHALAATLAGAGVVLVLRMLHRSPRPTDVALLALACSLGVLLRSEMMIWALAVAVVIIVVRRSRGGLFAAATVLTCSVGARLLEQATRERILPRRLDGSIATEVSRGWLADRGGAAWHVLAGPGHRGGVVGLLALAGAVLVLYGALRWRQAGSRVGAPLMVAGALAMAARLVLADGDLSTGIVVAWPVAFAAIVLGWRADRPSRVLAALTGLYLLGVLATQHAQGGGLEWGGRYLAPVVVAVSVLAAGGVARLWWGGWAGRGVLVAVALLPVAAGVTAANELRSRNHDVVAWVITEPAEVVITAEPALPRIAWATAPQVAWYRADETNVGPLLEQLHAGAVSSVRVQGIEQDALVGHGYRVEAVAAGLIDLRPTR